MSKRHKLKHAIAELKAAEEKLSKANQVVERCNALLTTAQDELSKLRVQESIRARTRLARLQGADTDAADEPNECGKRIFELEAELPNQKLTLAYAEEELARAKGELEDAREQRHRAALAVICDDAESLVAEARRQEEIAASYRSLMLSLDRTWVPAPQGGLQRIEPDLFAYLHDVSPFNLASHQSDLMDAWSGYYHRLLECADAAPISLPGNQTQTPENSQSEAA